MQGIAELTPVVRCGELFLKRDDLFQFAGVSGGKVRCVRSMAMGMRGLVSAGGRNSNLLRIVARVGEALSIPVLLHTASGNLTTAMDDAAKHGARVIQHCSGYGSVLAARSREDAARRSWRLVPYFLECQEMINCTRGQVCNIPQVVQRIVLPVGSGMSLIGVFRGLRDLNLHLPILGVCVGTNPVKRLNKFAPSWRLGVTLVKAAAKYRHRSELGEIGGVLLDPTYETLCLPYLRAGDLFWIVGSP